MKKLLCILTTLAMTIGAFSCSDKKSDKDSVWEEAVLETPFITLNDEDFSTINVTPTFSEDEPPVSFGSIDVGELDFGEKVCACAKDHDYQKYHPLDRQYYYHTTGYDSVNELSDDVYESHKGYAANYDVEGNTVYLVVNYEFAGNYDSHEWSIFTYDIPTQELIEIYSHSSTEHGAELNTSCFEDGKLWYTESSDYSSVYTLHAVDLETSQETIAYSSENFFFTASGNGLYIIGSPDEDNDDPQYNISLIDPQTYRITPLYSCSSQAEVDFILATGTTDYRLEKNEDSHKLDVITENYQIGTDLRSGDLCYADDSCFIIMVSDDYNSKIHYYDVEKREHYILDTTEYGSNIVHCGDGVILSEASYDFSAYSAVYYVIPPLGLIFKLTDTQEIPVTQYESDNTGNDDDIRSHGFFQYELRKRVTDNTCFSVNTQLTRQISTYSSGSFPVIRQIYYPTSS